MHWLADTAVRAAHAALVEREKPDFKEKIEQKEADRSLVTPGDRAAQALILKAVRESRLPQRNAYFVGEEGNAPHVGEADAQEDYQWVVDPVDGTSAYVKGGRWAVSIALQYQGQTVGAAIFCPDAKAKANDLHGTLYLATETAKTAAFTVTGGAVDPNSERPIKAAKDGSALRDMPFSCGLFSADLLGVDGGYNTDPVGMALRGAATAQGLAPEPMRCFCAAAQDVLEGKGACANGVNCEWDSAAARLLFAQADVPYVEYPNGEGVDGYPRFTLIAAPSGALVETLDSAYWGNRLLPNATLPQAQFTAGRGVPPRHGGAT